MVLELEVHPNILKMLIFSENKEQWSKRFAEFSI